MDKDNKRAFFGLSDLTSDTQTIPLAQPRQPTAISATKTSFHSAGADQMAATSCPMVKRQQRRPLYLGKCFLTFQIKPKNILDLTMEMQGKKTKHQGMTYHTRSCRFSTSSTGSFMNHCTSRSSPLPSIKPIWGCWPRCSTAKLANFLKLGVVAK